MAISYVGSASAASNTVAMPSHQAGDMIVIYVFNGTDTTIPTASVAPDISASWSSSGTNCAMRVMYNIADSASEIAGTWNNATHVAVTVYRKSSTDTWMCPVPRVDRGVASTITYAESLYWGSYYQPRWNNTTSWMVRFAGHSAATNLASTTPAGWSGRTGTGGICAMDSGDIISGDTGLNVGGNTQTVNASGSYMAITMQLGIWNGKGVVCMSTYSGNTDVGSVYMLPEPGDLILVWATRGGSNTAPTMPAGFTSLASGGADNIATLLCYCIYNGSNGAGTFTNATNLLYAVYRSETGVFNTVDLGAALNGNSTTMNWTGSAVNPVSNAITKYVRFGTFYGTGFPSFSAGWPVKVVRTAVAPALWASDADGLVAADSVGTNTVTLSVAMPWRTATVRIAASYNNGVENTTINNQPVPAGVVGCYVTLIGGGGGGGGTNKPISGGWGGGGGGGGATLRKVYIPVASLGATYSVAIGTGGSGGSTTPTNGGNGGSSTFISGSITLTAGGGGGGVAGGSGASTGGSGGVYSGVGSFAYAAAANGANGGNGSRTNGVAGGVGGTDSVGAPGGGGGGADGGSASAGGAGGAGDVAGGAAGSSGGGAGGSPADAGIGLRGGGGGGGGAGVSINSAGAGGKGSVAGAGGGGGGGKQGFFGGGASGGAGGSGYALVEWIYPQPDPSGFFQAYDGF